MLRKLMLAVIPMIALSGMVRADDFGGLADVASESSFEADALTAALSGDELVADAEVLAVSGSEATEDVDAEGVCFYGYGCCFPRYYGWGCCTYRVYRPVFTYWHNPCFNPCFNHWGYCW